ncbi:MAG: DUF4198 domain-containing protein [Pseudomonadota bacterium]
MVGRNSWAVAGDSTLIKAAIVMATNAAISPMGLFSRLSLPAILTYAPPMTFKAHFIEIPVEPINGFHTCRDRFCKSPPGVFLIAALVLSALFPATIRSANAHEFWLQPEQYVVAAGEAAQATIRVGEDFKGNSYSYNPNDFERFDLLVEGELTPLAGQLGDRPAMNVPNPSDGLLVGIHQSDLERLTYREFEKFEAFARLEGQDEVIEAHKARGLAESGFEEVYRRFAKTYVKVGDGAGADQAVGMALELVALTNPYQSGTRDVSFQLLRDGKPEANAQVAVWSREFGAADDAGNTLKGERVLLRTDEVGRVSIPTIAGREYLASAVLIEEPGPEQLAERANAVWYSLWASATWLATQ